MPQVGTRRDYKYSKIGFDDKSVIDKSVIKKIRNVCLCNQRQFC